MSCDSNHCNNVIDLFGTDISCMLRQLSTGGQVKQHAMLSICTELTIVPRYHFHCWRSLLHVDIKALCLFRSESYWSGLATTHLCQCLSDGRPSPSLRHPELDINIVTLRCRFEVEASTVPIMPVSFLRRDQVPATLAASREAMGLAGVPDAAIGTEEEGAPSVVSPGGRQLQPLVLRSDSARLSI